MATAAGADAVTLARSYLGTPYVWGGESPGGFDCSGLVQYVYDQVGIGLPRVSHDQATAGVAVPLGQIQPGDLIFSDWEGSRNSHVAIYSGGGKLIEAPQPGQRVHEIPLSASYQAHIDQVRRVIGGAGLVGSGLGVGGTGQAAATGGTVTGGATESDNALARGYRAIADQVGRVAGFFDALLWITKPDNIRRVLVGTAGAAFLALGIAFLVKAAR